ncbi:hypothetical protein H8D30_02205 [bacterium]|nr:hypothetical protein [bacterium]
MRSLAPSLHRVVAIARITLQGVVGNRRSMLLVFLGALVFGLSTWAIGQNADASVVIFTWSGIGFLFLVICYQSADGLREQLRQKTLGPIITGPLTRTEYTWGRFLGIWLPGWLTLSALFWLLFEYGVVRTKGYELIREIEMFTRQMGEGLPEEFGLPEAAKMAFLLWVLLSTFLFCVSGALFALSGIMKQKLSIVTTFVVWPLVSHWWRWNLPGWELWPQEAVSAAESAQMAQLTGWPSLPNVWMIPVILFRGAGADQLTLYFSIQSVAWGSLFLWLSLLAFRRLDLSRPQ